MDPSRYARVCELFQTARELAPDQRRAFLDASCGADVALIEEVRSMLASHDRSPGFLEAPVDLQRLDTGVSEPASAGPFASPSRIGRFRVLDVLGRGGMGTVFLAEQDHPHRRVALKVLHPGLTSPAHLRRFENEAEILGRLHHPGIAQIYEAGTDFTPLGAQPWFAMEEVRGTPLVEHADAASLSTRRRLELVVRVAAAVQHAHQHGVVHRDLKPANVLVDETGEPKVLDFGIARAAESDLRTTSALTADGELLGTLAYMSPEQLGGDSSRIDARTDVYALGVITYELLTGALPHDPRGRSLVACARAIREDEPRPLGSLHRELAGDVETIVAKALEKEPDRRYASAAEYAGDIQRHLRDEPVLARPASTTYQLAKFARRNRALVGGVAGIIVALAIGIVAAWVKAREATRARGEAEMAGQNALAAAERATSEAQRAQREAETTQGLMNLWLETIASSHEGREYRVVDALQVFAGSFEQELAEMPRARAAVRNQLAQAFQNFGMYDEVDALADRAVEENRRYLGPDDPETLDAEMLLSFKRDHEGDPAEAERIQRELLPRYVRALGESDKKTLACVHGLVQHLLERGALEEARELLEPAVEWARSGFDSEHPFRLIFLNDLARIEFRVGHLDAAEALERERLSSVEDHLGPDHPFALASLNQLANIRFERGDYAGALELQQRALKRADSILGPEHDQTLTMRENMAWTLLRLGQGAETEAELRDCAEIRKRVFGDDHPQTLFTLHLLGTLLEERGFLEEGEALLRDVVARRRNALPEDHPDLLTSEQNLADVLRQRGCFDEALELVRHVYVVRARRSGAEQGDTLVSRLAIGELLALRGELPSAADELRESLWGLERALGADHPRTLAALRLYGRALIQLGRRDEAEPLMMESLERERARLPFDPERIGAALDGCILLYQSAEPARAEEYRAARAALK
jgi:tetratricopeptide (TPR) repeat protein